MQKLKLSEKISYAIGDVGNGLAISSSAFWYLIFLTDVLKLSPSLAGLALMLGRIWNAISDPIMGAITDNTRSRWGKRRPYLLFFAPVFALLYAALWIVPGFTSQVALFSYILALILLFNTCFTVIFVPYTSMTAALTDDYNERISLTGFRLTLSQISFLLGATLPSLIVAWAISENGQTLIKAFPFSELLINTENAAKTGYAIMAVLFAVIIFAALWICFFGTEEKISDHKEPQKFSFTKPITDTYQQVITNRPFRLSALITLFTNIAATLIGINLPYYLQYAVGMKGEQHYVIGTLFLSAIAAIPLWVFVSKRFGKAETYSFAMICYGVVLCGMFFLTANDRNLIYVLAIAAGIFYAAALMLPWTIIPDVVEYDQLQNGSRREGLFYGGSSLIHKLASAITVFISASYLEFLGYVPNQQQSESVVLGLKMIIGPLPAVVLIFGIIAAARYPLNARKHKEILDALANKNN